ncbi:MAG TPA: multidrug transporter [Marinobacter sp.]|nr:multidrug transporter [Marinobacter sp.]
MSQEFATIILAGFGVILIVAGLAFFLRPRWLLGWLKGMLVFGVIVLGLYSLVIAINVAGYQSLEGMQAVATVSTRQQGNQLWRVTLQPSGERPVVYELKGDEWQLDARIIRFTGPLRWLGIGPGYRLERLGGRYLSLEQERSAPRSVIGLGDQSWPDLWALDQRFNLPFVEGIYGNATFMPMKDGALFDVRLSASGLVAIPVNEEARKAVRLWDE